MIVVKSRTIGLFQVPIFIYQISFRLSLASKKILSFDRERLHRNLHIATVSLWTKLSFD